MKMNLLVWMLFLSALIEQTAISAGRPCLRIGNSRFDTFAVAGATNAIPLEETFGQSLAKARNGDVIAQYHIGGCYEFGDGVDQNHVSAVEWYRKVAEQTDEGDRQQLASCYGVGQVEQSLAVCYDQGRGVKQNYVEAVKWYRKAATKGERRSQNNLGASYHDGLGAHQSYLEAVKWFRRAAEAGLQEAQTNLGWCYARGEGVTQDFIEAYKWASLAATDGNSNAVQLRGLLRLEMTPAQVAEGQQLAREFTVSKLPHPSIFASDKQLSDVRPLSSGTGFIISEDGFLISNAHVIGEANNVRLVTSAGLMVAKVVKVDAANDLVLLKAEGVFSPLPVVASRGARLGNTVATVGFPNIGLQGFSPKLAKGEIASLSGAGDDARCFQISVPVQPGNSGGALVDERGNVVGVVSAKLDTAIALAATGSLPENVNYAIKSSYLLSFLESVPEVSAKLKAPNTEEQEFEDVVKNAEDAAVLVLVY